MTKTQNYRLNQWEPDDKVQRDDFNADNAAIESALTALAAQDAILNSTLGRKGNVTLSVSTYEGDGTHGASNPTRVSFSRIPTMFIIAGPEGFVIGRGGQSKAFGCVSASSSAVTRTVNISWSGASFTMYDNSYPGYQMNMVTTHYVFAFNTES